MPIDKLLQPDQSVECGFIQHVGRLIAANTPDRRLIGQSRAQFIFIGYWLSDSFVNIHYSDIPSELAALKCELPTPLGRGYASRQEA